MKKANEKYLKKFEAEMITAVFADYVRNLPTADLMEMDRIYTEETGKNLRTNYGCSSCILKLLRQCGRLYFTENLSVLDEKLQEKFKEKYKITD